MKTVEQLQQEYDDCIENLMKRQRYDAIVTWGIVLAGGAVCVTVSMVSAWLW